AVGDQGEDERARGVVDAQAAAAREFLHIPEIDPALGTAVAEFVGAVAKIRALNVGGDAVAVGDDRLRRQRALLEGGPIDRLGQSFAACAQPLHGIDRCHVEFVAAGLYLGLGLGVGYRRDGAD